MKNFIIIFVLIAIIGLISRYIYKSKKNGKKCIGCPYSETCGKKSGDFDCCRD
ncbi:MAG: FeoB-associated Cys-rich membrane protein [Clostridia bacterium]|nr:FeoB-associated Cys-rich membrane protein [Clostridia bacterium]